MSLNNVLKKDIDNLCNDTSIPFDKLLGKTVLVTGATGLIGKNIIYTLATYSLRNNNGIQILAFVRDLDKAKKLFSHFDCVDYVVGDITQQIQINDSVDYIIHGASQTASKSFVNEPVETINIAIKGTTNILELAKEKQVKGFVYLSSMEVYGAPDTDDKITENYGTNLDTMAVRTSYPESKRMCESICTAYAGEYGIPAKVARLTQTFGPCVEYDDGRVFAEFIRCVMEKKDIVLRTKGDTKRCYLYTADAVSAILTILINGKNGEAYNVANEETYCSIYEMACLVAKECGKSEINVRIEMDDISKYGYAPVLKMNLDTEKLRKLGWRARTSLSQMFLNLMDSLRE